ncbi:hypothetical protein CYMTET_42937 [Cymbomonas tetramitiformis]|uniref:Uncharacterized protein n=1 Tax=Cymbomonas tetramitiformis TaxID=36881 RepID=A0AAE0C4U0_9CHLO|nr:hypothetical protein CYMTET_42937 [Cymbomonas tetramitiformis]
MIHPLFRFIDKNLMTRDAEICASQERRETGSPKALGVRIEGPLLQACDPLELTPKCVRPLTGTNLETSFSGSFFKAGLKEPLGTDTPWIYRHTPPSSQTPLSSQRPTSTPQAALPPPQTTPTPCQNLQEAFDVGGKPTKTHRLVSPPAGVTTEAGTNQSEFRAAQVEIQDLKSKLKASESSCRALVAEAKVLRQQRDAALNMEHSAHRDAPPLPEDDDETESEIDDAEGSTKNTPPGIRLSIPPRASQVSLASLLQRLGEADFALAEAERRLEHLDSQPHVTGDVYHRAIRAKLLLEVESKERDLQAVQAQVKHLQTADVAGEYREAPSTSPGDEPASPTTPEQAAEPGQGSRSSTLTKSLSSSDQATSPMRSPEGLSKARVASMEAREVVERLFKADDKINPFMDNAMELASVKHELHLMSQKAGQIPVLEFALEKRNMQLAEAQTEISASEAKLRALGATHARTANELMDAKEVRRRHMSRPQRARMKEQVGILAAKVGELDGELALVQHDLEHERLLVREAKQETAIMEQCLKQRERDLEVAASQIQTHVERLEKVSVERDSVHLTLSHYDLKMEGAVMHIRSEMEAKHAQLEEELQAREGELATCRAQMRESQAWLSEVDLELQRFAEAKPKLLERVRMLTTSVSHKDVVLLETQHRLQVEQEAHALTQARCELLAEQLEEYLTACPNMS